MFSSVVVAVCTLFYPQISRELINGFEEGTGHHSVIKYKGQYYAIYHGRDLNKTSGEYKEARTARVCKLNVSDGIITATRYADRV